MLSAFHNLISSLVPLLYAPPRLGRHTLEGAREVYCQSLFMGMRYRLAVCEGHHSCSVRVVPFVISAQN